MPFSKYVALNFCCIKDENLSKDLAKQFLIMKSSLSSFHRTGYSGHWLLYGQSENHSKLIMGALHTYVILYTLEVHSYNYYNYITLCLDY